jgi:DNA modification methylase
VDRLFFNDPLRKLYKGDCRQMAELPDKSIQCAVTSPPYYAKRYYQGEQSQIWGGTADCPHEWGQDIEVGDNRFRGVNAKTGGNRNPEVTAGGKMLSRYCLKCGAWQGSFGHEPTPEEYVEHTLEVLREVKRVLRDDGVLFWNIGDSSWGSGQNYGSEPRRAGVKQATSKGTIDASVTRIKPATMNHHKTLKPKDLCLIPERVVLAAHEDGWWVRSVIIWNKPNGMPESVNDRPTTIHEYIYMLTKKSKYYWDALAVQEPFSETSERWGGDKYKGAVKENPHGEDAGLARERSCYPNEGKNLRSVWTFPTASFPGSHHAVFPEEIPERCIKAASRPGDTILDPFSGTGTTLYVAARLGRYAVSYEISEEYAALVIERNKQGALPLI